IEAANPGITPTNVPPGTTIALPVITHTIATGDTLAALAGRFGLQVSDLAAQQVNATATILVPNTELALPASLQVTVADGTTLQELASALGLTVDALAGRAGARKALFETGVPVARPNARARDIDQLFLALVGSGQTASVAGMSAHFMLHGLRLPEPPDAATGAIDAFYRVTGQQFPAPGTISGTYDIGFARDAGAPAWVQPTLIHVTQKGETVATIASLYPPVTAPEIMALNPGIDPNAPPATVRVPQSSVGVTLDQSTLTAQSPSTSFDPGITAGPTREPLFHAAPIAHSVGPQVPWTAPDPPTLPGTPGAGGQPSLWRLPPALLNQVASGLLSGTYLLGQSPKGAQVADPPPAVQSWSWATFLPLTVRRVASPAGDWLDGTYLLEGADQTDRDTLLALWTHLQASQGPVQLFLAYPAAAGGAGLVSDALDAADRAARVAVLKANLSTETHSGGAMEAIAAIRAVPPATDAYASLAAPVQFLQLAWEASVTGSGGFYLAYTTAAGTGLPASAFTAGEQGQVYLVAVTGDPSSPDRGLHPFTTGAVVADNLDPSRVDVFAYAQSGDTTVVTTAPPGNVAYSLARSDPSPGTTPTAEDRTQSLFSLLACTVAGTGFQQPRISLPEGPKSGTGGDWEYGRTIPVYKLVTAPAANLAELLPPGASDPYTGIAKDPNATG
ncbi:MAG TPA: LysM domain-containing protein, partial [Asanoa sp.]